MRHHLLLLCLILSGDYSLYTVNRTHANVAEPQAYAILIGPSTIDVAKINQKYRLNVTYGGTDFVRTDINNVLNALDVAGFAKQNIMNLSGRPVIRAEVLDSIQSLAARTKVGDLVFLYFTGHGDQVDDQPFPLGDEPEGLDEVLVLSDDYLKDDDLNRQLRLFKKGERLILIVDACHSGTSFQVVDIRTKAEKLRAELLERKKSRSNKVFEDELERRQSFNTATCTLRDFSDNTQNLDMLYYGGSADDEEGKASTQGSFFTTAFTSKFKRFPAVWKTLTYRSLYCGAAELIKTSSQGLQSSQYKEIGNVSAFTNVYPLKIK